MSDTYCYTCRSETHQLELSDYESKLTARIVDESLREPLGRVFAPHRAGLRIRATSDDVIALVGVVLDFIKSEGDLLHYRYSLTIRGQPGSEGGGISCRYQGQHATAESGPGYCRITATRLEKVPIRPGGPLDATAVTVLADLRNMQRVVLDDGTELIPHRRKVALLLEEKLRDLLTFINAHSPCEVEQIVRERT